MHVNVDILVDRERAFLQQLRKETDDQHKKLEAASLSLNLLKPDTTVDEYAAYLLHMREVIAFCEAGVFPLTAFLFEDIGSRYKLAAIDKDLAVVAPNGSSLQPSKVFEASVPPGNVAYSLGFMYVVEGSTLGGRFLLEHVKKILGFDMQNGARFFSVYGSDTGKLWKNFLNTFSAYAVAHNCEQEIIAGSQYAFTAIENLFS